LPPPPPPPEGEPNVRVPLPLGGLWAEPLFAADRVRYVGEPVAIVITDETYQGEDAAELVSVDYEPLPAVIGIGTALADGSPLCPNAGWDVAVALAKPGEGAGFEGCDAVVERTFENQRLAPVPMEGRAAAARWADDRLTCWVSTQNAQVCRFVLAGALG